MNIRSAVCFALTSALPWAAAAAEDPAEESRYQWTSFRLREISTIDNKVQQTRRLSLLKLDTATGRVWQYDPQSLTVNSEGVKGEFGHFVSVEVEGLPETPPADAAGKEKDPGADKKKPPPPPPAGRYGFVTIAVPRTVFDLVGDKAGVVERDELFLTDRKAGHNWIFDSRLETVKKDNVETKVPRTLFTRLFNADELVVVDGTKKEDAKPETAYKLKKSLAEWKDFFLEHRVDKNLPLDSKPKIDCVIVVSKDDSVSPLVVMRKALRDTKAVAVTPWQMELYSDFAVDYLCNQTPVEFDKAERYLIFVNTAGRAAKGFNGLLNTAVNGMPDQDKISKLTRVQ